MCVDEAAPGPFDVILICCSNLAELARLTRKVIPKMTPPGGLWLAWPKKQSGVSTDLSEPRVRALGLGTGLVDNKICAVDETWSALRFVVRLRDRA